MLGNCACCDFYEECQSMRYTINGVCDAIRISKSAQIAAKEVSKPKVYDYETA